MRSADVFTALNRFGLGAAPGEAEVCADDPRGFVLAQIGPETALPAPLAGLRRSEAVLATLAEARLQGDEARDAAFATAMQEEYRAGVLARAGWMIATPAPLRERLVQFWANHFTVSAQRRQVAPLIPGYEREVIRPHVFGRFADMLAAAVRHPALLVYLDNPQSIGPASDQARRQPRRRRAALNENLAREVLELHTLGAQGGYGQEDVIQFALALTGWSHGGIQRAEGEAVHGRFEFVARHHQPGPKVVLGQTYAEAGADEGLMILADLARHPSTARHIAGKLLRHFVADDPPAALVAALARVFLDSDGDLAEVTRTLVAMPPAWADPLAKIKSHHDFVIAAHRAAGQGLPDPRRYFGPLRLLSAEPFNALSPAGYGDTAADWLGPEALMIRVEWARQFAAAQPGGYQPGRILEDTIGAVAHEATRTWVQRAPSADAGLAMILASAEFQRR